MVTITTALRIHGPDLEPEQVSRHLRIQPSYSHKRGDANRGREGREYAPFDEGMWTMESSATPNSPLDAHVEDLMRKIDVAAVAELKQLGYRIDLYVGVFLDESEPVPLLASGRILMWLAQAGADVDLTVYPAVAV